MNQEIMTELEKIDMRYEGIIDEIAEADYIMELIDTWELSK